MRRLALFILVALVATSCTAAPAPAPTSAPATVASVAEATTAPAQAPTAAPTKPAAANCTLRLSTTTSTDDSGLLKFILPDFEKKFSCKVDVVAVGTGQAIEIGTKGDADVLLVHARAQEDKFVADGHAKERLDVMHNDFIVVGPKSDPAKVNGTKLATDAFKSIMNSKATFASRGDNSGTNTKELSIWTAINFKPAKDLGWYNALGQGMGETLLFANEKGAYTLTDRATWLATKDKLPNLIVVVGGTKINENGDKGLLNPYGVMAVNPDKHPGVNYTMAMNFVKWITSPEEQKVIASFGADKFGQSLFYPDAK